jgi:hypothetical protein
MRSFYIIQYIVVSCKKSERVSNSRVNPERVLRNWAGHIARMRRQGGTMSCKVAILKTEKEMTG